jgi:hypothetical protein
MDTPERHGMYMQSLRTTVRRRVTCELWPHGPELQPFQLGQFPEDLEASASQRVVAAHTHIVTDAAEPQTPTWINEHSVAA